MPYVMKRKIFIVSHNYMMLGGGVDVAPALAATDRKDPPIMIMENKLYRETLGTLTTGDLIKGQCTNESVSGGYLIPMSDGNKYIVRRLTPLECCRLQGFPDDWCDDVEGSDTNQYKMWGNGVALPCVDFVIECIKRKVTEENGDR